MEKILLSLLNSEVLLLPHQKVKANQYTSCSYLISIIFIIMIAVIDQTVTAQEFKQEYSAIVNGEYWANAFHGATEELSVDFGDLDGDGDLDLVQGSRYRLEWMINSGNPVAYQFDSLASGNIVDSQNDFYDPALVDIDNDGDLDLFCGVLTGGITFFENTGNNLHPIFSNPQKNYAGIQTGYYASPEFCDIDNDGDYDLFIGDQAELQFFRNNGSSNDPVFNKEDAFTFSTIPGRSCPELIDIDNDDDLDLFLGSYSHIYYYENIGTADSASFAFISNSYKQINQGVQKIVFADIDTDSDYDLFATDWGGNFVYYKNVGIPTNAEWQFETNFFTRILNFGRGSGFATGDIDGDGDNDILYDINTILENVGTKENPEWLIDNTAIIADNLFDIPELADIDGDNDLDLLYCTNWGTIYLYRNQGSQTNPGWVLENTKFMDLDFGTNTHVSASLADIDGDSDLDLFIQHCNWDNPNYPSGGDLISFYENVGNKTSPDWQLKDENYMNVGGNVSFGRCDFGDMDSDGDIDCLCGNAHPGNLLFYRNIGDPQTAVWSSPVTPIGAAEVESKMYPTPVLVDLNNDGMSEIISGHNAGGLNFWWNIDKPWVYETDTVTDFEGNVYNTVKIGEQWWMSENLASTVLNDGTSMPLIEDSLIWIGTSAPAYCWYMNDQNSFGETYGALYNWHVINTEKLCPQNWHVPSNEEWSYLTQYLGGDAIAGGKLKGFENWVSPNRDATNKSKFTALPGGYRINGNYSGLGLNASFWTSLSYDSIQAYYRNLSYNSGRVTSTIQNSHEGFSVRCVQDGKPLMPEIIEQPVAREVMLEGSQGRFTIKASGNMLRYIWQKDGINLPENERIHVFPDGRLEIKNLVLDDSGEYRCTVANDSFSVVSNVALLEVVLPNETGSYTDPRDEHVYKWVKIGPQTWFAENLAYLPDVSPQIEGSATDPRYYVYDYQGSLTSEAILSENYSTNGVLYNLPAALNSCPTGWHLPSDDEWKQLERTLGMDFSELDQEGARGINIGKQLKDNSLKYWLDPIEYSSNTSGFTGLPAGYRNPSNFNYLGKLAIFWSSSPGYGDISVNAWIRYLFYFYTDIFRTTFSPDYGFSVRCLMDSDQPPPNIISFSPSFGIAGRQTRIIFIGSGFNEDGVIEIGQYRIIPEFITPDTVIFKLPGQIKPGLYDIKLKNPDGQFAVQTEFEIKPLLTILSPNGGETYINNSSCEIRYIINADVPVKLEFSSDNGFTWSEIIQIPGDQSGEHNYIWTPLPSLSSDYCRIRISDPDAGDYSDRSDGTFSIQMDSNIPAHPANLYSSNAGYNQIVLSWDDNSSDETGFKIYRRNPVTDTWTLIDIIGPNSSQYTDSDVDPNTQYLYKVCSFNDYGHSSFSNSINVLTPYLPEAPSNLMLRIKSISSIELRWQDNSTNETGFIIDRRTSSGVWKTIRTVGINSTLYIDSDLESGTSYQYRIKSFNPYGESEYSGISSAKTGSLPATPTLSLPQRVNALSVKLTWFVDDKDDIDNFIIYRRKDAEGYQSLISLNSRNLEWIDDKLEPGSYYYYKVCSKNEYGEKCSNLQSYTTGKPPSTPEQFRAELEEYNQVKLSWKKGSANTDKFLILIYISNRWYAYATLDKYTYSFIDDNLKPNTLNTYQIIAKNEYGESSRSNTVQIQTGSKPDDSFSATITAYDKNFQVVAYADVFKRRVPYNFSKLPIGKTDINGKITLNSLMIGDEILFTRKFSVEDAVKMGHEPVDKIMYELHLDNGNIQSDGNYSFLQIKEKKSFYFDVLDHPVFKYNLMMCFYRFTPRDLTPYKTAINNASNILFDATDGHVMLNKVAFVTESSYYKTNKYDLLVQPGENSDPQTYSNAINTWDYNIKLGMTQQMYKPEDIGYARILAHELIHYALGMYDEYEDGTGNFLVRKENEHPAYYSIMDNATSDLISGKIYTSNCNQYNAATELSSSKEYLPYYSRPLERKKITKQYFMRKNPGWEYFKSRFENKHKDLNIIIKEPVSGYYINREIKRKYRIGPSGYYLDNNVSFIELLTKKSDAQNDNIIKIAPYSKAFNLDSVSSYFLGIADFHGNIELLNDESNIHYYKRNKWNIDFGFFDVENNNNNNYKYFTGSQYSNGTIMNQKLEINDTSFIQSFQFEFGDIINGIPEVELNTDGEYEKLDLTEINEQTYFSDKTYSLMDSSSARNMILRISYSDATDIKREYIVRRISDYLKPNLNKFSIDGIELSINNIAQYQNPVISIASSYCIPIGSRNQNLIPVSEVISISVSNDLSIQFPFSLTFTYNDYDVDSIDENTLGAYKWNNKDFYWEKLDSVYINSNNNAVSLLAYETGSYTIFAGKYTNDSIQPARIEDLTATPYFDGCVQLNWTATGDDGLQGMASRYEIRWFEKQIDESNWDSAYIYPTFNRPGPSGSMEEFILMPGEAEGIHYYAIKAFDEAQNSSVISNIASSAPGNLPYSYPFGIIVSNDGETLGRLYIGRDVKGSNLFDPGLDIPAFIPDSGIYSFIKTHDGDKLEVDYRSIDDSIIIWEIHVEKMNYPIDSITLTWDSSILSADGSWYIGDIDMLQENQTKIPIDTSIQVIYMRHMNYVSLPDIVLPEDFTERQIKLTDYFPDSDSLVYKVYSQPDHITSYILTDTLLMIKSIPNWNGVTSIEIEAQSKFGNKIRQEFNIDVLPVNDPPYFESTPIVEVYLDSVYEYLPVISDVDQDDTLTLTASALPGWLIFNPELYMLSGTPAITDTADTRVILLLSDGIDEVIQDYAIDIVIATETNKYKFNSSINVYPNPTEGKLIVESSHDIDEVSIEIINLVGQRIINKTYKDVQKGMIDILDIECYPDGLYTIKIWNRSLTLYYQVIKQ